MPLLETRFCTSTFQSTRPARGATTNWVARVETDKCFNPRAPHGARHLPPYIVIPADRSFNPRAPHGARQDRHKSRHSLNRVSIHAPRTGRDVWFLLVLVQQFWFQSTRPARGATGEPFSDRPVGASFNPRSPHGARQHPETQAQGQELFQSTRPARGATGLARSSSAFGQVSIHAPRTGRDFSGLAIRRLPAGFNPRAPHGARRLDHSRCTPSPLVSIHAPRTGRDDQATSEHPYGARFNPRAPHGARPYISSPKLYQSKVSIHAPRTGRDRKPRTSNSPMPSFNPRAPHGARRLFPVVSAGLAFVSIHAPRTGRDNALARLLRPAQSFNPRAPHGARLSISCASSMTKSFNPRAPHGARHDYRGHPAPRRRFQSTRPARGATRQTRRGITQQSCFNPRAPHGARRSRR